MADGQVTPPAPNGFNAWFCKACRYHYAAALGGIRTDIGAVIADLRGTVALLHQVPSPEHEFRAAMASWQGSSGDYPDVVLVASARDQGLTNFLSDDADLAIFDGITPYTANRNAVVTAAAAGWLIN